MILIDMFTADGLLYVWLYDGAKNYFHECSFSPKIYVLSNRRQLDFLKQRLSANGLSSQLETGKTLKGEKLVLAVQPNTLNGPVGLILKLCRYSCEIFNSSIPIEEHYMFEQKVFPTCNLEPVFQDGKIISMATKDSPMEEYAIPNLKVAFLGLRTGYPLRRDINAPLISIEFDGKCYGANDITRFAADFSAADPDIVLTEDGELELPYLLSQVRKTIPDFSLSRFGIDQFRQGGSSYFSYGRVIFKRNAVYLKGRLHLQKHGTLYGSWTPAHAFELARVCRVTLQRADHRSVGYCVSNLQTYYAMKKGFLIPRTSPCVEVWKSGEELFNADRGPLIFEPQIGYHENVAELDFTSLYPSLMVKHNISTETLFCRCCRSNRVPGLAMNICTRDRGIMAEMLEPIIKQRCYYKSSGLPGHKERADALKGLLVTSFGYMGFRKSKLSRIEAHQAIQAYARESLLGACKIAEQQGFEVLHGIVDSLWVKGAGDINKLTSAIKEKLGLEIRLEGIYKWIVFLPSTSNEDVPVPTRYYGVFKSGEVKCRGIEVRRHDTPELIRVLQMGMVKLLAESTSREDFLSNMKLCKNLMRDVITRLQRGLVSEDELLITRSLSKSSYASFTAQAVVQGQLKAKGYEPNPGEYVSYVITDKGSSMPWNRYNLASSSDFFTYDKKAYSELARRAYTNIFTPFITSGQLTIFQAINNDNKRVEAERVPVPLAAGAL